MCLRRNWKIKIKEKQEYEKSYNFFTSSKDVFYIFLLYLLQMGKRTHKNKSGGIEMKKTVLVTCMLMLVFGSMFLFGAPDKATALMNKGVGLYHKNETSKSDVDLRKAIEIFTEVFEKFPEWNRSDTALMYKGLSYMSLGEVDNAIDAYTTAVNKFNMKGFSESTYFYLGYAYYKKGDLKNARKWFNACVNLCKSPAPPYKSAKNFPYKMLLSG